MIKNLLVLFVIFLVCSSAAAFPLSFIGSIGSEDNSNVFTYDYCVRADGTSSKVNATSCDSSSTSMSLATLNASSFLAGEEVAFSGEGGGFTSTNLVIPSGGTVESPIVYKGVPDSVPDFSHYNGVKIHKSHVALMDMISRDSASTFEFGDGVGTYTGVETYRLKSYGSSNQSFQHLDGITVVHHDLYANGAADEGISLHNDTAVADPIVTIYGAEIVDCANGLNWVGAPTLSMYDFTISGLSATGKSIDNATGTAPGIYIFERGYIVENPDQTGRVIDCPQGNWTFKNVIFKNLTDGDYYILARSTVTGFKIINCTFVGDGTNSTTAVFNQYAGVYINNIFVDIVTAAFYAATGTIDYNIFDNSGATKGTNIITGDAALDSNGKLTSSSTIAFDAGVGPSVNANVPVTDIDGDTRSGTTTDLGADLY